MKRLLLGVSGKGKSQRAFQAAKRKARFIIYTPMQGHEYRRGGHPELAGIPRVPDDNAEAYAQGFKYYFDQARQVGSKGFYITTSGNPIPFFEAAWNLRDCALVIDDPDAYCDEPSHVKALKSLYLRMNWCGIDCWVTTHRYTDLDPKLRVGMDEIYWHGPLDDEDEAALLFKKKGSELRLSLSEFRSKLKNLGDFDVLRIK